MYTSNVGTVMLLGALDNLPLVDVGDVCQTIDPVTLTATNKVRAYARARPCVRRLAVSVALACTLSVPHRTPTLQRPTLLIFTMHVWVLAAPRPTPVYPVLNVGLLFNSASNRPSRVSGVMKRTHPASRPPAHPPRPPGSQIDIAVPVLLSLRAEAGLEVRSPRQFKVQFTRVGLDTFIRTPQLTAALEVRRKSGCGPGAGCGGADTC